MAQLPDRGDAFVISRSRSARRGPPTPRLRLSRAAPLRPAPFPPFLHPDPLALFDPADEETPVTYSNSGVPSIYARLARFRGELFLQRDSLTRRPQIAFRISVYMTLTLSLSLSICLSLSPFLRVRRQR